MSDTTTGLLAGYMLFLGLYVALHKRRSKRAARDESRF